MAVLLYLWMIFMCLNRVSSDSSACSPDHFGWNCRFRCLCQDGQPCDQTTGYCSTGCPPGKWGIGCLLDNDCAYNDERFEHYRGHKNESQKGHECQLWTAQVRYKDNTFREGGRRLAVNFCRNPTDTPQGNRTWCYYNGTKYDYCSLRTCECPVGLYGINCEDECHCDGACNQTDGSCLKAANVTAALTTASWNVSQISRTDMDQPTTFTPTIVPDDCSFFGFSIPKNVILYGAVVMTSMCVIMAIIITVMCRIYRRKIGKSSNANQEKDTRRTNGTTGKNEENQVETMI